MYTNMQGPHFACNRCGGKNWKKSFKSKSKEYAPGMYAENDRGDGGGREEQHV